MDLSYRPAQVYAGIRTSNKIQNNSGGDGDVVLTSRDRQIQVTGIGEVSVPPDRFSITIKVSAQKDNAQDAKNSVKRRLDYIQQTLGNYHVQESDIRQYKHMQRVESKVLYEAELCVEFLDLQCCQAMANLLVEKLDSAVSVSLPECFHSKNSLDIARKKCALLAIHSAKEKAKEMARFVHLLVGRPLSISETETKESANDNVEEPGDPDHFLLIKNKLESATINISSHVTMCFELKSKGKHKSA